jgi:GDP-4-dehydro-6-deoxy-D-mannose reductase
VNVLGTLNVLLAAKEHGSIVVFASSSSVYGDQERYPVSETFVPRPRSPYAASKLAAEAYCYQAGITTKAKVVIARPFNHIGPGQSERFLLPALARQIVEIKEGRRPPLIEVGNIDVTRDFSDVRDVIHAYVTLLKRGSRGETYNVCSGVERNVGAIVLRMLELSGVKARVKVAEDKLRPNEQTRHCGSNRKLCADTGWQPRIPFEQSISDLLRSWKLL